METKLKSNLANFEVIDFIQRDMAFNRKISFSDMVEYLAGALRIYVKNEEIEQMDSTYTNRFGQKLKIATLICRDIKVIIREKVTQEADVKFVPFDPDSEKNAKESMEIEEL